MSTRQPLSINNFDKVLQRTEIDCLRCCIAMAGGFLYDTVPDFVKHYQTFWAIQAAKWLLERNRGWIHFGSRPSYVPNFLPLIVKGFPSIGSKHHHCMISLYDGFVDPSPNEIGISEIVEWYAII